MRLEKVKILFICMNIFAENKIRKGERQILMKKQGTKKI